MAREHTKHFEFTTGDPVVDLGYPRMRRLDIRLLGLHWFFQFGGPPKFIARQHGGRVVIEEHHLGGDRLAQ